ncbi:hypothetical protein Fot_28691 [Forsythia ovata]|uniref:Uncharacterized protein n=1 Tax=Forsythia ovata TaxID=205694 RepID=A0ABD1TPR0_9LAMI
MRRVVFFSNNESSIESISESHSRSSSHSSDHNNSAKLIDQQTSLVPTDLQTGESRPSSEITRQSTDLLGSSSCSTGTILTVGRMPPIRSSSANIQISRSPFGHIIPFNIPKGYNVCKSETKLDRMLGKFKLFDNHTFRAPNPTYWLPSLNPFEIAMYKDSIAGGLMFPIHLLFVAMFHEFHLNPNQGPKTPRD